MVRSVTEVTDVMPGSPAAEAGVRPGDIIVSFNGQDWTGPYVGIPRLRPGEPVRLVVERDRHQREVRMTAGTRPEEAVILPRVSWTVTPDSIVERLFLAMDSLRVRIMEDEGLRRRIGDPYVAGDSVVTSRGTVVRLRAATSGERTVAVPFDLPAAVGAPGAPEPGERPPFGFYLFRGPGSDSLAREMHELGESAPVMALDWTLGDAPWDSVSVYRPLAPYLLGQNRVAGAEVVDLRPELAEYFQVEGGILVVNVPDRTPASSAGIQPGDVLIRMDGAPLRSIDDLRRGLVRAADDLPVTLVRKGRTIQVLLKR